MPGLSSGRNRKRHRGYTFPWPEPCSWLRPVSLDRQYTKDGDKASGPKSPVETLWLDAQKTMCEPLYQFVPEKVNESSVISRFLKIDAGVGIGLDDGTSVEISGIRFCGVASAHEGLERDELGRAKYLGYVFSNSAVGRFTTAVTQSGTKGWQRDCGLSESTLRFFPSMGGRRNGAFQVTYPDAKPPSWRATSRRNWLYRVISTCLNSIPPHRTNSSTNARRRDSHSKCYAAANHGTCAPGVKRRRL
jgi:hypothetical protein